MKNIGFIGLGNMGKGMSINLSKNNNLKIFGFDINPECKNLLKNEDIKILDDIQNLSNQTDVIITMLPDGKIVKKVWTELIKFSKPNKYLIDCSTIDV